MTKNGSVLIILIFCSLQVKAQVPVSKEPLHKPVFQNKYIRLLDVVIQPGDTSLFHIHATPSVFVYLSTTRFSSQIKGKEWVEEESIAGKAWYRSFSPDILVHRVSNRDTIPFHVNDIEILSSYDTINNSPKKPLPFPLLFENEKSFAYHLEKKDINKKLVKSRGPLTVELITGNNIFFYDTGTNQSKEIKAGHFLYINPGTSFYFDDKGTSEINMIVFEIK
jgi:hypothetical protein